MEPDDELCLCFHVSRRKVENYIRRVKPQRPSQLSECHGAGTGCGWCRPFLARLLQQARGRPGIDLPSNQEYAQGRGQYVRQGKGQPPPGATPLPQDPRDASD